MSPAPPAPLADGVTHHTTRVVLVSYMIKTSSGTGAAPDVAAAGDAGPTAGPEDGHR